MLNPGQVFDSKYEILKILGSGSVGTVYLAQNIKLGTLWAIKEVNKNLGDRVDLLVEPNILKKLSHPYRPDAYKEGALAYFKQRDFDGCINYLNSKSQVYRKDLSYAGFDAILAEMDYILGTAYYGKKEYENAVIYIQRAIQRIPNNPDYNRDLAVCLAKGGRTEDALDALERAIESGLLNDSIAYANGEIFLAKDEYKKAAEFFLKAIDITKNEEIKARAFLALADIYIKDSDIDSEIKVLERAQIELKEKDNIVILELLADAYTKKGMQLKRDKGDTYLKSAASSYEKLLSLGYKRSYIMRNISILYQYLGELNKNEKLLMEMKEIFPDDYKVYMQLVFLYVDMESKKENIERDYSRVKQNYEQARKLYIEAQDKGTDDPEMIALERLINELKDKKWI